MHGATCFPSCWPQGAGTQLETSFAVCGIFQILIFLGFPDPHPTGDHICAPPPADQQSDHLHRPWIHSLRRVPLSKNHFHKSDFRNGIEWGKWAQTSTDRQKNLIVVSAIDSCRLLRGATSLHTLQDYSEATARGGTETT